MGYYDDHSGRQMRNQKGNRGGAVLAGIVGAVLGGLLVLFSVPALSNLGVFPYAQNEKEPENELTKEEGLQNATAPSTSQNVSLSVVTEITKAVDVASDAVVGVVNLQQAGFWSQSNEAGTGSGVIYKKQNGKAYIVTNQHVIEGANQVEVSLSDGTRVPATVRGGDVWTDLAVLEIDAKEVKKVATFGNSDVVRAGEPVIAIGNPLGLQFSGSVTQGIISGTNRTIEIDINEDQIPDWHAEVLQTDAAINPGNSGGALVNINGQLIGINSMKIAQNAVEGIGLAIPINYARPIISDLEQFGEVRRPYMGVSLRNISEVSVYHLEETLHLPNKIAEEGHGVAVIEVTPNSPATLAGLQQFDVIIALDGKPIFDVIALRKHLYNEKQIGERMEISFYRDGELQKVTMKLEQAEKPF